ncbi:3'(2'),5'-bisphosphate nucleotidase CysQ family protein [Robertkochia sediminum]|uniref:3'(2'),5'-bisphosphate nucleotidase CysQ family protein n=1 Tax=Robertkochia sediminum TaxID=2785326 RepID=UPI001933C1A1|nr:inositol monophosphatase family protein [Robertkochia sediminum]MBL7472057.1 inositol monophosphatase family protein [Robertkochia sediminum]
MELSALTNIAIQAAKAAGKIIQQHMNDDAKAMKKEVGSSQASQVVTAVDMACEKEILSYLLPTCREYELGLLTEELEDDGSRFKASHFWCIDPMDGTLPFINKQPGFSVSIALITKDGSPQIGVVFDPVTDTLYHAVKGEGAFKNGEPWSITHSNDYLTYVTDKELKNTPRASEIKALLAEQAERLNLNVVKELSGAGSVMNAIRVLENGPACMLKLPKKEKGGGSIWDFAATACIFHELGLPATNFARGRLVLNRKDDTFMNREGVFYGNLKS